MPAARFTCNGLPVRVDVRDHERPAVPVRHAAIAAFNDGDRAAGAG